MTLTMDWIKDNVSCLELETYLSGHTTMQQAWSAADWRMLTLMLAHPSAYRSDVLACGSLRIAIGTMAMIMARTMTGPDRQLCEDMGEALRHGDMDRAREYSNKLFKAYRGKPMCWNTQVMCMACGWVGRVEQDFRERCGAHDVLAAELRRQLLHNSDALLEVIADFTGVKAAWHSIRLQRSLKKEGYLIRSNVGCTPYGFSG